MPILADSDNAMWKCLRCKNVNRSTENNCLKCSMSKWQIGHTVAEPYMEYNHEKKD